MTRRPQPPTVPEALNALADQIEATCTRWGWPDIPASGGHYLIESVVYGYDNWDAWRDTWVDIATADGVPAANEWAGRYDALRAEVARLVYPGGAVARSASPQHIRALADTAEKETAR